MCYNPGLRGKRLIYLTNLTMLSLHGTDMRYDHISRLTKLKELDISGTDTMTWNEILQLPSLTQITIVNNESMHPLPDPSFTYHLKIIDEEDEFESFRVEEKERELWLEEPFWKRFISAITH